MKQSIKVYPLAWLTVLLVISVTLSGCLLNRLMGVKEQFCDFHTFFSLKTEDGVCLVFEKTPLFYKRDVLKILGIVPTEIKRKHREILFDYTFQKSSSPSEFDLKVGFAFVETEKEDKLKAIKLKKTITAIIPEFLIIQVFQTICQAEKDLIKKTMTINFDTVDRSRIPLVTDIEKLIGKPDCSVSNPKSNTSDARTACYNYTLKTDKPGNDKEVTVYMTSDPETKKLIRVHCVFDAFDVDADFNLQVFKFLYKRPIRHVIF